MSRSKRSAGPLSSRCARVGHVRRPGGGCVADPARTPAPSRPFSTISASAPAPRGPRPPSAALSRRLSRCPSPPGTRWSSTTCSRRRKRPKGTAPQPGLGGHRHRISSAGCCCPGLPASWSLLAFAVAGLRWVKDGAAAGFTAGQAWLVIGALGGHAAHAFPGRRQPDIAARLLPVAAGHRLLGDQRNTGQPGGKPAPFGTKDFPGATLSGLRDSSRNW